MEKKDYYTPGELANLFQIPRQTMFHYAKMGLLTPEFITPHGYRQYALSQYLVLEMILTLRKLDVPISVIKDFLQNRSKQKLLELWEEQERFYIEKLEKIKNQLQAVQSYQKALNKEISLPLHRVVLRHLPDCRMYVTPIPEDHRGGFHAISIRAKHMNKIHTYTLCHDRPTGWIIGQEDFFSGLFHHSCAIVTKAGDINSPVPCNYIAPAGLYVSILFRGTYFKHAETLHVQLSRFMTENHLSADGNIFLFPISSYWESNDPGQYINSLIVKVVSSL